MIQMMTMIQMMEMNRLEEIHLVMMRTILLVQLFRGKKISLLVNFLSQVSRQK